MKHLEYAKGKSDTIAKLDGTFKIPTKEVEIDSAMTDLQRSVFGGAPPVSMPKQPPVATSEAAKGVKRGREEEESEQEDAPMEEDDEGSAMEESDSE